MASLLLDPDPGHTLHAALLDSRQRWRAFGALATDLAFETDGDGRLVFIAPDGVLGWPGASLLGQPVTALLAEQGQSMVDPFRTTTPVRGRRTWLAAADGAARCFDVSLEPLDNGPPCGVRGIGVDVTARERADAQAAAALRRGGILDHILIQMRQEILAPRMMEAVLTALMRALGAAGVAVLDLGGPSVTYAAGGPVPPLEDMHALLHGNSLHEGAVEEGLVGSRRVLACPASTRFGERASLLAWRGAEPGGPPVPDRPWDMDDLMLAGSVTGVIRIVLEHEAIQRELARQARTDPLTNLLNRRAFLEDAGRRLDRLDREGTPGTLLFLDLDRLKQLNDHAGHEAGDAALVLLANLLRRTFRPTDLLARLGGDEFALWLDGSDELTAAERAEHLRVCLPKESAHLTAGQPHGMTLSTGIACRYPGSGEDLDQLISRADAAMYEVKRAGGGQWKVCHGGRMAFGGGS